MATMMMTTTQKWENITLLITAKAEHKDKNMYIEGINLIMYIQEAFIDNLRQIIHNKIEEYNNHRKTMLLPDFNEIIEERNYETDCPVCFETMYEGDKNCCMTGSNCEHLICMNCYYIITEGNNKCPICRKDLINNITEEIFETDEEDEDEQEELWNGTNDRPTTDLFFGRRWYNVEEDRIEYWSGVDWRLYYRMDLSSFMSRQDFYADEELGCCQVCGIQRTLQVDEYIRNKYNNQLIINDEELSHSFDDNQCYTECFECLKLVEHLNQSYESFFH